MKRLALIALALFASFVPLACDKQGEDDEFGSDTSSESESESTDTTGTETGSSESSSETGGACPDPFPSFEKVCSVDSDCALVFHTIDCCGTALAWGINANELPAFDLVEATCDAEYPECDCAPQPTMAEDGNQSEDWNAFAVACQMGSCTSYLPMP